MREIQSKEEKNIEETARTVAIPHPIPTFDHSCDFWWLSYKSQWHCELFLFKDQPLVNVFNGPAAPAPWVPWVLASHGCHAWSFCYMRVTQILESSCPQARGKHCWVIAGDVWVIVGGLRCTWDTSSSSFTIIHQFYCFWCFCCLDVFILDCPFVLVLRCNKARQTHGASWCHHRNTMPESFWEASWTLCRCHIRAHILRTTLVPFTAYSWTYMIAYCVEDQELPCFSLMGWNPLWIYFSESNQIYSPAQFCKATGYRNFGWFCYSKSMQSLTCLLQSCTICHRLST